MGHSIRGRIILIFIGMAIGPLLVIGILLAWLGNTSQQPQAITGISDLVIVLLILAVIMGGIAAGLGYLFARKTVEPIQALTEAAGAIGAGDLTARPQIPSDDEIGILAGTFNGMARQLRERIGTLEHHVADRTKALATFREISRLSTLLDETRLSAEVAALVKHAFHYYYAQIFLYDPDCEHLIMADGQYIPQAESPVGRAAKTKAPVLVGEIAQDPGWQPNPLAPKTKSEAAVPIALGDQVLGVLDVQQNISNGLTQADVDLLQTIANQVAVALRNTRSNSRPQSLDERQTRIASINQKIRETTTVEDALQVAERELQRALGSRQIRVVLSASGQAGWAETESQPGDDNP